LGLQLVQAFYTVSDAGRQSVVQIEIVGALRLLLLDLQLHQLSL